MNIQKQHLIDLEKPANYAKRLAEALNEADWSSVELLVEMLEKARKARRQVFLCGNGGSAANAVHWANDLSSAMFKGSRNAIRAHALPANEAIVSCLANDLGYENIFSQQLRLNADPGDILVIMSGSGNSPNIIAALHEAKNLGMTSVSLLGFDGGKALGLTDHPIHFKVHDMQIVEDLQLCVGHMVMRCITALNDTL